MQPGGNREPLTASCYCSGTPHTDKCRLLRYADRQRPLPFYPTVGPQFKGETYSAKDDQARLGSQLQRVRELMSDGQWRTLAQISAAAKGSEASVSARLRDLRREGLIVDHQRKERGLWLYRVLPGKLAEEEK